MDEEAALGLPGLVVHDKYDHDLWRVPFLRPPDRQGFSLGVAPVITRQSATFLLFEEIMKTQHRTLRDARVAAAARRAEGHRARIMRQSRPGRSIAYTVQTMLKGIWMNEIAFLNAISRAFPLKPTNWRGEYQKTYYPYYNSDGRRLWLTVPNDC